MPDLLCPKCQAPLRSYERSGVVVDRCTECGGLFLDRGELEHLIDVEGRATPARQPVPATIGRDDEPGDDHREPDDRRDGDERGGHRRKGGFLSNLLDLGGGD